MTATPLEEKIALLLAKAESTTPEEAEALTEHAERLMLRHGIEQAAIDAARAGRETSPEPVVQRYAGTFTGVYGPAYLRLGCAVAEAYGIAAFLYSRSGRLIVVGHESDALHVHTLITSLVLQARVALDSYVRIERKRGGSYSDWSFMTVSERTRARRDFLHGFGAGAAERLAEVRRTVVDEAEDATPGTTIALVDRGKAVEAYLGTLGIRKGRGWRIGDVGYADGRAAGRRANVGGTALSARRALGAGL
jgi:hypothetical protein